jgi:hypothetical protein
MPYIILRDCWCHIIVLNVHALTEDKIADVKDIYYKEVENVFGIVPKLKKKVKLPRNIPWRSIGL